MKIIKFNKNFYNQFQTKIEKRNSLSSKSIQEDVKKIINDVKKNGDKSLIKYAAKFDKVKISKNDLSLDLSEVKIIFLPSGDQAGSVSIARFSVNLVIFFDFKLMV